MNNIKQEMDKRDKNIDEEFITIERNIEPLNESTSTILKNVRKLKEQSQRPCQLMSKLR